VLDSSCGLGLHTIAFHEAGLNAYGADRSAFAVARAQGLARIAGHDIPFFRAAWHDLPDHTEQRFDAIFWDALSWIATRPEFQAALDGLRAALRPGGVLLFLGAPEGAPADRGRQLLLEKGEDFLDRQHLFLIEEATVQRLECATIRESVHWTWERLLRLFSEAGFSDLATYAVQQWSSMGMPAGLNIAVR
jgi:SAM-dependent methyltransferase